MNTNSFKKLVGTLVNVVLYSFICLCIVGIMLTI